MGEAIWADGAPGYVGCVFPFWGEEQEHQCGGLEHLLPGPDGSCHVCIAKEYVDQTSQAPPNGLRIGFSRDGSRPGDFSCLHEQDGKQCTNIDGIQVWFPFDKPGPTFDDVATGNVGTARNGASQGKGFVRSGALVLDGQDDFVEVPHSQPIDFGTGDFSIDFWIKTKPQSGARTIIDKRQSNPYRGYHVYIYRGSVGIQLADGGSGGGWTNYNGIDFPSSNLADGKWHLVVITVDRDAPDGLKFYIDGRFVGAKNPQGRRGSLSNNRPAYIGRWAVSSTGFFGGSIDELELFGHVLTPEEIARLWDAYNQGKCE